MAKYCIIVITVTISGALQNEYLYKTGILNVTAGNILEKKG